MPRETTLSLIRRYYDAFNAGDPEGMLACLTDDIEHRVNEGGHRIGQGEVPRVLRPHGGQLPGAAPGTS